MHPPGSRVRLLHTFGPQQGSSAPLIHCTQRHTGTSHSNRHVAWTTGQRRCLSIQHLDEAKRGRERVVILGSGWAGYNFARTLDSQKFQPILVSPRSYFVFTPLLASTSVGTLEFRTALEPNRNRKQRWHYIQGRAYNLDFYKKTVAVEEAVADPRQGLAPTGSRFEGRDEREIQQEMSQKSRRGQLFDLSYDKLVIAVGSYSQTFGIPGVKENANFLKDVGDARKIRKKLLECFEAAALPTTTEQFQRQMVNFAVVGGGPTGIEFSAELHDLINDDLSKIYPVLAKQAKVTVYDVAPTVLSMFDRSLSEYAMKTFQREGINIRTSVTIQGVSKGIPQISPELRDLRPGLSLKIQDEPDVGCGLVVWSTGLMANPFIQRALTEVRRFPPNEVIFKSSREEAEQAQWSISKVPKAGSIVTNDRLRVIIESDEPNGKRKRAYMRDVFAIGDCAVIDGSPYPATAQVANQKAEWLAKRINHNDLHTTRFTYKNLGVMAYIGNWNAILQGGSGMGNMSGRTAWLIWRGAYLVKSISWRNRILIPIYWLLNWAFGRDISRF